MHLPDSRFRILNITHSNTTPAHTYKHLLHLYNYSTSTTTRLFIRTYYSQHHQLLFTANSYCTSTTTSPHLYLVYFLDYPFYIRHKKVFCRKTAVPLSNLGSLHYSTTAKKEEQALL